MQIRKLVVIDWGVKDQGILPKRWEVDIPFNIPDHKNLNEKNLENLEFFRKEMQKIYQNFCDGKISLKYDYELIYGL